MPLSCENRGHGLQTILLARGPTGTAWATGALSVPRGDLGSPLVTLATLPPDKSTRIGGYTGGSQRFFLRLMPFCGEGRVYVL
jgi:hypothetical protein